MAINLMNNYTKWAAYNKRLLNFGAEIIDWSSHCELVDDDPFYVVHCNASIAPIGRFQTGVRYVESRSSPSIEIK